MTSRDRFLVLSDTKIKPNQLLINDIGIDTLWHDHEPRLELSEVPISTILNEQGHDGPSTGRANINTLAMERLLGLPPSEHKRLRDRQNQYGWMADLRLPEDSLAHCRWIHMSSKFPENIAGVFQGLSDWSQRPKVTVEAIREITKCLYEEERFSKHGKMFAPFIQPLIPGEPEGDKDLPMLISTPFLDWSLDPRKPTPPLRFQIDEREAYFSSKQSTHPLRSLLQYHYRLEDTSERETSQVFLKHKPWYTDRELDLKVRRWYGHHPSSLIVDELWVLVIDSKHIVTFASNQTWKSRWPPLQVSARIEEVSFRGIRDMIRAGGGEQKYSALTHAVTCLHGAIGLMHRSFWTDIPLSCTDRYADYLSHLQYRIYRQPSTKLVMDLLQVQDELNIVLQIMNAQLDTIEKFSDIVNIMRSRPPSRLSHRHSAVDSEPRIIQHYGGARVSRNSFSLSVPESAHGRTSRLSLDGSPSPPPAPPLRPWLNGFAEDGDLHLFNLTSRPIASLERKLRRELDDLTELRNNANELINRTVQLVNIRMEDHGQVILVFTVVTVIFLPLSFVASVFSMNVSQLQGATLSISYFWAAGFGLTALVLGLTTILAFYGGSIRDKFSIWKAGHESWMPLRKSTERSARGSFRTVPNPQTRRRR